MNLIRPESYLSPFLLSYLSKYIKDLEPKNFQLSLWGGDAVLHNVKFKLDALDDELLGAPFSFVNCQAQELSMHVPWSKLASEPIVITLNTVECVLKLECSKKEKTAPSKPKEQKPAGQPSYIDGLIKKIKNNINIVINNLILKYIEDDLVLSVNIQSLTYRGVDDAWHPAFIEMSESSFVLRHLYELKDITVCLDKRDASGQVESYEDPLLFRCHAFLRQHATYPSQASRKPLATKLNLMIDRYELNISETQLPAFLRLLQLSLHIYYGTIHITRTVVKDTTEVPESNDEPKQGWGSWAWSYVPPIVSYDEAEEIVVKNTIIALGIYIKNFKINLKPAKASTTKQFHRSSISDSPAIIEISAHGVSVELVAKGLEFFSCTTSICNCSMACSRTVPFHTLDHKLLGAGDSEQNVVLAQAEGSAVGFLADSLFDFRSPENNDTPCMYALSKEEYFRTSAQPTDRAFLAQYLYIASDGRYEEDMELEDFSDYLRRVKLTDVSQWGSIKELSWKNFIIGGKNSEIMINSHFLACCDTLRKWAGQHSFKSYPLVVKRKIVAHHKPNDIPALSFVPVRSAVCKVKNLTIAVSALHLDFQTSTQKAFCHIEFVAKSARTRSNLHSNKEEAKLPVTLVKIAQATFTMKQPMYAQHLAAHLSLFRSPRPVLMQACNTQYTVEIDQIDMHLKAISPEPTELPFSSITDPPIAVWKGFVLESHVLQSKEHWSDRLSMLQSQSKSQLQGAKCLVSLIQLEMLLHVVDSWLQLVKTQSSAQKVLDVAHVQSVFDAGGKLEIVFDTVIVEINQSFARNSAVGGLQGFHVGWHVESSQYIPVVHCVSENAVTALQAEGLVWGEESHWLCAYLQMPLKENDYGCLMLNMQQGKVIAANELFNILLELPTIPSQQLLPVLYSVPDANSSAESSANNFVSDLEKKCRYAIQLHLKGVHLYIPGTQPDLQLTAEEMTRSSPGLHICLPEVTACTSGHKRIKLTPLLLKQGIVVNSYTEFQTLNCSMERAELFTSFPSDSVTDGSILHLADPCAAACTVVLTPGKGDSAIPGVAVHLDVEPICLKISRLQVTLLVDISNVILSSVNALQLNNMMQQEPFKMTCGQENLSAAASSDVQPSLLKDDSKSNFSALANRKPSKLISCTVWLQCTLPRFTFTTYCDNFEKTVFVVEDMSLSLDYQAIYLKLVSSCSMCVIDHFSKLNDKWEGSWNGVMLSSMFSKMPSFLQTYDSVKEQKPGHTGTEGVHSCRKFFEVTFTQALTSDYQRHLQDELQADADVGSSSAITDNSAKPCFVKQSVSELICLMQRFDFLVDPNIINSIVTVFVPLQKLQKIVDEQNSIIRADKQSPHKSIDLPLLYFNITGARLFFPCCGEKLQYDNVFMLCADAVDINPHPLNPLSRLVLAPSMYKRANAAGLLQCAGSALQDKQIEISLQEVSCGTARWSDILSYMNIPKTFENPALQWNMAGHSPVLNEPVFHPIVQEFNFQATVAPSIWYLNSMRRWTHVCGPSLEASFAGDVVMHLTKMQTNVVHQLSQKWSRCYNDVCSISQHQEYVETGHPEDSGLSVCGSSHTAQTPVVSANVGYLGDGLLTAHNVKILIYQFVASDNSFMLKPQCCISVREPSVMTHISRHQQKAEVQVHDVSVNVASQELVSEASFNATGSFPIKLLETLPGNCDERTGVPPSLLTVTAQHFLSSKASIKANVGRPAKVAVGLPLINILEDVLFDFSAGETVQLPKSSATAPVQHDWWKMFSSLSLHTRQLVAEVRSDWSIMRCALSNASADIKETAQHVTCDLAISDVSIRLKPDADHFLPLMYPVSLQAHMHVCRFPQSSTQALQASIALTPTQVFISFPLLKGLHSIQEDVEKWANTVFPGKSQNSTSPIFAEVAVNPVSVTSKDDLRSGMYTYITSDNQEPLPHQIVFSALDLPCMSWCYDKPNAVQHLHITPVPFNVTEYQTEIMCSLQSFNEVKKIYEEQAQFALSESDEAELTLFTDATPVHGVVSATKWRVVLQNTDTCSVSPMSLAAAMQVDSIFNVQFIPNLSFELHVESFLLTNIINSATENFRIAADDVDLSAKLWNCKPTSLVVAKSKFVCLADVIDYANMTWLPLLKPTDFCMNLKRDSGSVDVSCSCDTLLEVNISQKVIKSVDCLMQSLSKQEEYVFDHSCILFKNNTGNTVRFGQSGTDECISLAGNAEMSYSWRSNKIEQLIHVSVESSDLNWSETFQISAASNFTCAVGQTTLLIVIEKPKALKTIVNFRGPTQIINRLPFSVHCTLSMCGDSDALREVSLQPSVVYNFLFSSSTMFAVSLKVPETSYEPSKLLMSKLTQASGNSVAVHFPDQDGKMLHCQICYQRDDLHDVIVIIPLFVIRSHLPEATLLHVETRSSQVSSTMSLQGKGNEFSLLELSPFVTHHLTIQIDEHQSPFDAKVPIHSSLTYTMDEMYSVTKSPMLLSKHYPYNDAAYTDAAEDHWVAADGNIQARLSLHAGSLLVEVTPWCLLCNNTSEVLCVTSPDNATSIVQPGQITVPHHFNGLFQIRTSNGSGSEWLTLVCEKDMEHPSRAKHITRGYIPPNSVRNMLLKKQNTILDVVLKSCVRHGIRILTLAPRWWFVNRSTAFPHARVKPCVNQDERIYCGDDRAVEISNTSPVPLLCWQSESNPIQSDKESCEETTKTPGSVVESVEETSSSFLCVDSGGNGSQLWSYFTNRTLYIRVSSGAALVSVDDEFAKRIVDVHLLDENTLSQRLMLTKHLENNMHYLVLSDICMERYRIHNGLSTAIAFKEVTEGTSRQYKQVVNPAQVIPFESHKDAESFPRCGKVFRSIKLQLSKADEESWTELVVPDVRHVSEVSVPGLGLVCIQVNRQQGCVVLSLQDPQNDEKTPADGCTLQVSYNCQINLKELKFALLDDLGNPLFRRDVLHICVDKMYLKVLSDPLVNTWDVHLSVLQFQVDNQLLHADKSLVFLWSSKNTGKDNIALQINATLTKHLQVESADIHLGTLEFKSDSVFAQVLSHLLQSYVHSSCSRERSSSSPDMLPVSVQNEVLSFCSPLRVTTLSIHPFILLVSMRASVKLHVSVDRGALSFSKFVCRDLDTTTVELLQEISRHYVADAIYGAGWVLGSLDLLGNPASTLRSFAQGVTDLVILPYQGLSAGPTGFLGGFAQGVSSLLRHLSSGTLRSVTNIATSISRNLRPEVDDNEEYLHVQQLTSSSSSESVKPKSGYVAGFGKALLSVVTVPVGGAANIVSKAGESILRRVGVEKHMSVRHGTHPQAVLHYPSSASKYASKIVQSDGSVPRSLVSILPCSTISSIGVDFEVVLVLAVVHLYIVRLDDDTVESVLPVQDIQLFLDATNTDDCILIVQQSNSPHVNSSVYKEKVAVYLGMEDSVKKAASAASTSEDFIRYKLRVENQPQAALFCALFNKLESKVNNFEW